MLEAPIRTNYPEKSRPIPQSEKWWLLPNFDIEGEIDCLFKIGDQKQTEGLDRKAALDEGLKEVRGNLIGFKLEFLMQEALLPNPVAQNREGHLINAISGQRILPMITEDERCGAVYDSFTAVEDFFKGSENGSMAIIASPPGPSGLKDSFGRAITYPDHQMYMFRKNEIGKMEAFTVVSDMNYQQTLDFMEIMGKDRKLFGVGKTEEEKLAAVVRNAVFLPPTLQGANRFEDIISNMQTAMGTDVVRVVEQLDPETGTKKKVNRTFAEVYQKLALGERLLSLDSDCERVVGGFEEFTRGVLELLPRDFVRRDIEIKLWQTINEMYLAVKGKRVPVNLDPRNIQSRYRASAMAISMISGCSGGGMGGMETPFGIRRISLGSELSLGKKSCDGCKQEKEARELVCGYCKNCGD